MTLEYDTGSAGPAIPCDDAPATIALLKSTMPPRLLLQIAARMRFAYRWLPSGFGMPGNVFLMRSVSGIGGAVITSQRNRKRGILALTLAIVWLPVQAFDVPTANLAGWTTLSFNDIRPNDVSATNGALQISVDASASPLIYRFEQPLSISGVTVVADWSGELRVPAGAKQGSKGADDFVLKFGIVESGEQTLNWFQRRIAADWIKELFALAPEGSGVQRILFLSTTQSHSLLGSSRTHPLSDLLHERRITHLDEPGRFTLTERFAAPVKALGLWISSDGDDTASSFELRIQRITLQTGAAAAD